MNIAETFLKFIDNLGIKQEETMQKRYRRITKTLNKKYFDIDDEFRNSIYAGSYGRDTAIGSTSDVDMIFILPDEVFQRFNRYESNGQSALLQEVKSVLLETYPATTISGDGQVVVISFKDMQFELLPAFEQSGGDFQYPDTNEGGSWKKTDPRSERKAINELNNITNKNFKRLCKMTRAWKNECGVSISGLLIDTLCYNYVHENIDDVSDFRFSDYHSYSLNFFNYLGNLNDSQKYWRAPGSNQNVYNEESGFCEKALTAKKTIEEAIEKNDQLTVNNIWKSVFGACFPSYSLNENSDSISYSQNAADNEEFIENKFLVSFRERLKIDCLVTKDGFRPKYLSEILKSHIPLNRNRSLQFSIKSSTVTEPFEVYWKVRNIGEAAIRRNCLRGQIVPDKGGRQLKENTNFHGPHYVECYIIKNGICVAKDRIDVPIC